MNPCPIHSDIYSGVESEVLETRKQINAIVHKLSLSENSSVFFCKKPLLQCRKIVEQNKMDRGFYDYVDNPKGGNEISIEIAELYRPCEDGSSERRKYFGHDIKYLESSDSVEQPLEPHKCGVCKLPDFCINEKELVLDLVENHYYFRNSSSGTQVTIHALQEVTAYEHQLKLKWKCPIRYNRFDSQATKGVEFGSCTLLAFAGIVDSSSLSRLFAEIENEICVPLHLCSPKQLHTCLSTLNPTIRGFDLSLTAFHPAYGYALRSQTGFTFQEALDFFLASHLALDFDLPAEGRQARLLPFLARIWNIEILQHILFPITYLPSVLYTLINQFLV